MKINEIYFNDVTTTGVLHTSIGYFTFLSEEKALSPTTFFSKAMILIRNVFGIASCLSSNFLGFTLEKWNLYSLLPETTYQFSKNHQFKIN